MRPCWVAALKGRNATKQTEVTESERAELRRLRKESADLKMNRAFVKKRPTCDGLFHSDRGIRHAPEQVTLFAAKNVITRSMGHTAGPASALSFRVGSQSPTLAVFLRDSRGRPHSWCYSRLAGGAPRPGGRAGRPALLAPVLQVFLLGATGNRLKRGQSTTLMPFEKVDSVSAKN